MNGAAGEKNSQGKGADIAKEEAAAWARQMEFIIIDSIYVENFRLSVVIIYRKKNGNTKNMFLYPA